MHIMQQAVTVSKQHVAQDLCCRTGTGTGTGDPVLGSPDPVMGNAWWRPLGSQGENKSRKNMIFIAIYIQVYTDAAPE
jgi:hypothetical protein